MRETRTAHTTSNGNNTRKRPKLVSVVKALNVRKTRDVYAKQLKEYQDHQGHLAAFGVRMSEAAPHPCTFAYLTECSVCDQLQRML